MEKFGRIIKRKRIPRAKSVIERELWKAGGLVCGLDEVGRGCLAGPVITAAVILHPKATFALLKDSKVLTAPQRVRAAKWIKQHSWYAYGIVSHREIDEYNIYQATLCAMRRAVAHVVCQVPHLPSLIVVDAMPLTFAAGVLKTVAVESFPFGEQRSISVAAASILAKVKRDELMNVFDRLFPGYALKTHKGYATRTHRCCVHSDGRCLIHRQRFLSHLQAEERANTYEYQVELFCRSD
jgi:ribonuclease HII